jgi:hypothetical protein
MKVRPIRIQGKNIFQWRGQGSRRRAIDGPASGA